MHIKCVLLFLKALNRHKIAPFDQNRIRLLRKARRYKRYVNVPNVTLQAHCLCSSQLASCEQTSGSDYFLQAY